MITADQVRQILNYDPETGAFTWRMPRSRRCKVGASAGCVNARSGGQKHLTIMLLNKSYRAHRLAWLYVYGAWPAMMLDHANGDALDNRIGNLRIADSSLNAANTRLRATNKSGFKGVSWHPNSRKWMARIQVRGKTHCLGYFAEREGAFDAYKRAAIKHFGEFARPEFLPVVSAPGSSAAGAVGASPVPAATNMENE